MLQPLTSFNSSAGVETAQARWQSRNGVCKRARPYAEGLANEELRFVSEAPMVIGGEFHHDPLPSRKVVRTWNLRPHSRVKYSRREWRIDNVQMHEGYVSRGRACGTAFGMAFKSVSTPRSKQNFIAKLPWRFNLCYWSLTASTTSLPPRWDPT